MVSREFNAAVEQYARAVAIIEQGRAKWPGQAGDKTAGRCLTASFRLSTLRFIAGVCIDFLYSQSCQVPFACIHRLPRNGPRTSAIDRKHG